MLLNAEKKCMHLKCMHKELIGWCLISMTGGWRGGGQKLKGLRMSEVVSEAL